MKSLTLPRWIAIAAAAAGSACTLQQGYNAAQSWQQNECRRLQDPEQRSRCLKSSATSYEEYLRQTEALGNRR